MRQILGRNGDVMDRRSLLKMFGFGAVATALPAMPAAAKVEPTLPPPQRILADCFRDPLYADVYTEGPYGERYIHPHPASLGFTRGGEVTVSFDAEFTGTIKSVTIRRGDMDVCYIPGSDFAPAHVVRGQVMMIAINIR
jgi:hypothetical protein